MQESLQGTRRREWVNVGGQLMLAQYVDQLRADVGSGRLASWEDIHQRYDEFWNAYPLEKQKHAFATLGDLNVGEALTRQRWLDALQNAVRIQEYICDEVYATRKKDYENPFRQATFRNSDEMTAAIGTIDENDFVQQVRQTTEQFRQVVEDIAQRG